MRLADLDGVTAALPPNPEVLTRRTRELVADLVQLAKSSALEKLGEGERAFDIAVNWLRNKVEIGATPSAVAD